MMSLIIQTFQTRTKLRVHSQSNLSFQLRNLLSIILVLFTLMNVMLLTSCSTLSRPHNSNLQHLPPKELSELQQGKRFFETGYYKHAMRMLLPLACDGVPEAQYAVGYMYYYGYGVAQDTDVGMFWIRRAASKGYGPAEQALSLTHKEVTTFKVIPRSAPKYKNKKLS